MRPFWNILYIMTVITWFAAQPIYLQIFAKFRRQFGSSEKVPVSVAKNLPPIIFMVKTSFHQKLAPKICVVFFVSRLLRTGYKILAASVGM